MEDDMLSEPITTQVKIVLSSGNVLIHSTDMAVLKLINLDKKVEYTNPITELKIGTLINIGSDDEFKVIDIKTLFYDNIEMNDGTYGMSTTTEGKRYPFNFQVVFTVEQTDK